MAQAFIIMQIGNPDLDKVCREAIVPAIESCDMEAKRVDKHNKGGLLKSEIIKFIANSEIIIADITNERQNCYLEIGYAMGIDKFRNLILTAREDHFPESPRFKRKGPKIHFDLGGYDILAWEVEKLHEFRTELEKRIKRRLVIIGQEKGPKVGSPEAQEADPWDQSWLMEQQTAARTHFVATGYVGAMEIAFAMNLPKKQKSPTELNQAALQAPIHTFGWPIGIYLGNRDEYKPKPRADGIVAEIKTDRKSYDYWAINRYTDFFTLTSFVEIERDNTKLFFDIQMIRVTEALLYCGRLYSLLGYDRNEIVNVSITHTGLKGRKLSAADSMRAFSIPVFSCVENEIQTTFSFPLSEVETNLIELTKRYCAPVFALFDFFVLNDSIYAELVNNFVSGK